MEQDGSSAVVTPLQPREIRAADEEHLADRIEEAAGRIDASNRDLRDAIELVDPDTAEHACLDIPPLTLTKRLSENAILG